MEDQRKVRNYEFCGRAAGRSDPRPCEPEDESCGRVTRTINLSKDILIIIRSGIPGVEVVDHTGYFDGGSQYCSFKSAKAGYKQASTIVRYHADRKRWSRRPL